MQLVFRLYGIHGTKVATTVTSNAERDVYTTTMSILFVRDSTRMIILAYLWTGKKKLPALAFLGLLRFACFFLDSTSAF